MYSQHRLQSRDFGHRPDLVCTRKVRNFALGGRLLTVNRKPRISESSDSHQLQTLHQPPPSFDRSQISPLVAEQQVSVPSVDVGLQAEGSQKYVPYPETSFTPYQDLSIEGIDPGWLMLHTGMDTQDISRGFPDNSHQMPIDLSSPPSPANSPDVPYAYPPSMFEPAPWNSHLKDPGPT